MEITEIWDKALISIKQGLSTTVGYDIYLKKSTPVSMNASFFTLSVKNTISKTMIDTRYKKLIESSIEIVTGNKVTLNTIVGDEPSYEQRENLIDVTLDSNIPLDSPIPLGGVSPRYTFDNFIVGSFNEFASAAAKTVSEVPGYIYNPLFIYGNSGLGKTHLMQAIGNKTKELHPNMKILYITGEKFTSDFIRSVRENKMQQFTETYRTPDVLLVDDVQFIESKEATQEEFFHTFNELFTNSKQIVLTSDRKPSDLTTLTDRLRTRFGQGLIIDISIPNFETRVAILQNKAADYPVNIDDEILEYIAEHVRSNIRELEGVLNSVISKSQFKECDITMDFVAEALEKITMTDNVKITPKKIIERTAFYYQISENDITGKTKTKEIAIPRQVAMYICRKLLSLGDTAISKEFDKDRTTVKHNIEKIEELAAQNSSLSSEINYIIKDIQSR